MDKNDALMLGLGCGKRIGFDSRIPLRCIQATGLARNRNQHQKRRTATPSCRRPMLSPFAAPSTAAWAGKMPAGGRHGCRPLAEGHGWPFRQPPAQARSAGFKRHPGGFSFGYFSLAAQRKVSRLSVRIPTLNWLRGAFPNL